jgi:hypothetical protein
MNAEAIVVTVGIQKRKKLVSSQRKGHTLYIARIIYSIIK